MAEEGKARLEFWHFYEETGLYQKRVLTLSDEGKTIGTFEGPLYKEVTEEEAKQNPRAEHFYKDQFDPELCTDCWIVPV